MNENTPLKANEINGNTRDIEEGMDLMVDIENINYNEFIAVTYGILAWQLCLTTVIVASCMYLLPLYKFMVTSSSWLDIGIFILLLVVIIALFVYKNTSPANWALLLAFTTLISLSVGHVCALYKAAGLSALIVQSLVITMIVFFSITAYCWYSKKDFTFLGGFLYSGLTALIGVSIFSWILSWFGVYFTWLQILISAVGILIFVGYILFDTSVIIQRGIRNPIIAAVELYLDVVNLFLYILQFLSEIRD